MKLHLPFKKNSVGKERISFLIIIMAAVATIASSLAIWILYSASFEQQTLRLVETVNSRTRLIEAMVSLGQHDHVQDASEDTLKYIFDANSKFRGFGNTGEYTLAELKGDNIFFLTQHRHKHDEIGFEEGASVPLGSSFAEPMQRAVQGQTGSMIGRDYRGEKVLAAYELVEWPGRKIGIVAKMDMSEIRAPFIKAGIVSGIFAYIAILIGAVIFRKISNPLFINLQESEERYALAMKGANDGLWDRNLETGEVYFSPRWKEMLGYDDDEIPNLHEEWQKRIHPDDYRRIMVETKDHLEGRTPFYSSEYRMRHRDGSYRWILARGASGADKNGKPTRFAGSHTDITERRQQEEVLRDYSHFLQVLIETIPSPVFYKDVKGNYLGCNATFEKLFGMARDSIIGKTIYDITSKELADRCHSMDKRTMAESGVQVYDFSVETPDGKRLDLIFNTAAFRKIEGTIGGLIGIIVDITERKKLENELIDTISVVEDSYKVWKSTFDAMPDCIVIYDVEFNIIKANATYQESAGLMLQEMIGLPYYDVYPKLEGPLEISTRIMEKGEEMKEGEVFIESLDKTFKVRIYPRYDEVERQLQFVQIMEDITEMKRTQNMLLQSAKLASVGEVSAGLAHELNNPMTSILGYTSLILDDMEEGGENYREMKVIERESLRVREIIKNILDFSRQRQISKVEEDINEVVRESLALVKHMAVVSGVNIDLDLADGLEYLEIDSNQMKQVFINLITNALHSMERGGRLLISSEKLEREDVGSLLEGKEVLAADDYIVLKFKDNGCGIPKGSLERIFEPFFSSKGEGGNGLGLPISYGIVKNHGGEILVNSKPGEGTEFSVIVPLNSQFEIKPEGAESEHNQLESIVA